MIIHSKNQSKQAYCEAELARELDKCGICPANHTLGYHRGWYYVDDEPAQRRPDLTRRAEQSMADPDWVVGYWPRGNCYVLIYTPES